MAIEPSYGTFGNLAAHYQKARQGFPSHVFDLLDAQFDVPVPPIKILDVGCGTGIATRQLCARGYDIVGADIDTEMITIAQRENDRIPYYVAPTSALPFPDALFAGVTAFSSLHWFADTASLREISRVLKPHGTFITVNKNDVAGFKAAYRSVLAQFIDAPLPNAKAHYDPAALLGMNGFSDVERHVFPVEERYAVDEALAYLYSVSLWNLVPQERKADAECALRELCEKEKKDDFLTRTLEVVAVIGVKKQT